MTLPVVMSAPRRGLRCASALSSYVARSGVLGIIGRTGSPRRSAWIWDFSTTESTTARSGGSRRADKVPKPPAREREELPVVGHREQHLRDHEADQLGIGQLRRTTRPAVTRTEKSSIST
jgi:hypothetical protein